MIKVVPLLVSISSSWHLAHLTDMFAIFLWANLMQICYAIFNVSQLTAGRKCLMTAVLFVIGVEAWVWPPYTFTKIMIERIQQRTQQAQ